jgi:hypothetical protein
LNAEARIDPVAQRDELYVNRRSYAMASHRSTRKNPYLRDDQTDQQLAASNYYGPSSRRIAPEISLFFASIPT